MIMLVRLSGLLEAFEWASASGPFENAAYLDRSSGKFWLVSDLDDSGEEAPEDVGDDSLYLTVPSKSELDLGRNLALRFASEHLPQHSAKVRDFFGARGAYARFKDLLEERGLLDVWYTYESKGPVLVMARVNDSDPLQVSLFPVGGGRHCIRIKAKVRNDRRSSHCRPVSPHPQP
jgi:hypothetical protein